MDNDAGDEIVVQNSLHLSRSVVVIVRILGRREDEVDDRGGGGSKANDADVPGGFGQEMKGMELSSHYLFYTSSFRVFFDSHTLPFGIVHCIIFALFVFTIAQVVVDGYRP